MEVKLSILIATIPSRKDQLTVLTNALSQQRTDSVEIIIDHSMMYNIGFKRNELLKDATGEYIVYIDDDDIVSPIYVNSILKAIQTNPDCIGINGTMTTNGYNLQQWFISKEYGHWYTENNIHYRTPNHISPVRRELALQAGFPEIAFAEDAEYSRRLLPLLKSETIITEPLYHYDYWQKNNIKIYGQLVYNHPLGATHEPTYPATYWDNIQLIQKEYMGNSDLMFCHNDTDNGKGILVIGKYTDDK